MGAAAPGKRRNSSGTTVSDLDWRNPDRARPYYREALLEAGVDPAVVKQGPRGVLAAHRDGTRAEAFPVPAEAFPVPVEAVNGLGAGDAFGGSLCHGPLAGWDPERTMRHADAAGALVASRLACSFAMPTEPEVADLLARAASPGAAGLPSQS
ncbi:PfkB family carbohydrate kinase [Streptomyces sp. NPDC057238]|uniref:PfkB family carbohydrate kinase n=1 Tax=Streptomyces sp. NPDC057238 TaxID=3346060 RepID=UPI00363F31A7